MRSLRLPLVLVGMLASHAVAAAEAQATSPKPLFTQDRDNYFLFIGPGSDHSAAHRVRFQLSFKFNLTPGEYDGSLFFGFTQKSIWDLWNFAGSSPFIDSNYNPALFFAWRPGGFLAPMEPEPGWRLLGLRAGIEHESNGQAGPPSRSWHRLTGTARGGYYLPVMETRGSREETHYWHVIGEARLWLPFGIERESTGGGNPDILRYYGIGQYSLEIGHDIPVAAGGHYQRKFVLGATGRVGSRLDRGYFEVWATYRPRWFGWFPASFMVDYAVGYGETLLRYNDHQGSTLRVGITLDDLLSTESSAGGDG